MIKVEMSDMDELKDLMNAEEYAEYVGRQKEEDEDEDDDEDEDNDNDKEEDED
jgi:hypothetical protein